MSDCEHEFGIGVIQVGDECIVSVSCRHCDLLVTAPGVVSDLGGGYTGCNGPTANPMVNGLRGRNERS